MCELEVDVQLLEQEDEQVLQAACFDCGRVSTLRMTDQEWREYDVERTLHRNGWRLDDVEGGALAFCPLCAPKHGRHI